MKKQSNITVLSTFAQDKLFNEKGKFLREQKGGPAYFIKNVFKKESLDFNLIVPKIVTVEILLTKKGEFGKISNKSKPSPISYSDVSTPYLLISTLLADFDLAGISQFDGKVFLDIQGYVRNGSNFGKKKKWNPSEEMRDAFYCIKGTTDEIAMLPSQSIKNQKNKLLLITNGKRGSVLYADSKKYALVPSRVAQPRDTLGAGDTFFAYFIYQWIKTNNPMESLKFATENTIQFLLRSKSQESVTERKQNYA